MQTQTQQADPASPARIFIGTDASQILSAKVFEYSVRRHSSIAVAFDTMLHVQTPTPKDPANFPRTGFSFNRFAIPKLAGYQGRAMYVDADMLVLRDLRALWDVDFDGATVLYAPSSDPKRPKQFSVLLLDCDRLRWDVDAIVRGLDENRYDYKQLLSELCIEPASDVRDRIPAAWNSLEEYHAGETCLIHYTDMEQQPWVSRRNKNGDLWVEYLRDAIEENFIPLQEVQEAIRDGFARPSLLAQLKKPRAQWPVFNQVLGRLLDVGYKPHKAHRDRFKRAKKLAHAP